MEINNKYTNDNFVAQFLARQDAVKPKTNPLANSVPAQVKEDTFVSSKDNSQPLMAAQEVKAEDTFSKSEEVSQKSEQPESEELKDNVKTEKKSERNEINPEKADENEDEIKETEEAKEEEKVSSEENSEANGENVKKKTNFIDKVKDFFKNLFMKFKPNKDVDTKKSVSAGGVN